METCNKCNDLRKTYLGEDKLRFDASCNRSVVRYPNREEFKLIKACTGVLLDIPCPDWCPKKRGVIREYRHQNEGDGETKCLPLPSKGKVKLSYSEKKEKLLNLPKHIKWEDIKEDKIYVIPKILFQSRKVVRVIIKNDEMIRCSEIDEYGNESNKLTSIYPKDIESVFITELLKF